MKKFVEIEGREGLEKLLGEHVELWTERYIYTGKLIGVNDDCVLLEDAGVVYETGDLSEKGFSDIQKLERDWYVRIDKIESYGVIK